MPDSPKPQPPRRSIRRRVGSMTGLGTGADAMVVVVTIVRASGWRTRPTFAAEALPA